MKEKTVNDLINSMDDSLKNRVYFLIGSIVILRQSIEEQSISNKKVIEALEAINHMYIDLMADTDSEQRAFITDLIDFTNDFADDYIKMEKFMGDTKEN